MISTKTHIKVDFFSGLLLVSAGGHVRRPIHPVRLPFWFLDLYCVRGKGQNTHQLCRGGSFVRKKPRFAHQIDGWSPVVAIPCVETPVSRTDGSI